MRSRKQSEPEQHYDPNKIVDAPEFHGLAKAMGTLTSSSWDHSERSFGERKADFLFAYPPHNPTRFSGGELEKRADGIYGPAEAATLLKRFLSEDWRPGSLFELLARHGLRLVDGKTPIPRDFEPAEFLATARRRNHRLRVLHGGVDIEAKDMDAEKVAWLERQERIRAAEQVREARKRMRDEHAQLRSKDVERDRE
jgi:hypothetical protein